MKKKILRHRENSPDKRLLAGGGGAGGVIRLLAPTTGVMIIYRRTSTEEKGVSTLVAPAMWSLATLADVAITLGDHCQAFHLDLRLEKVGFEPSTAFQWVGHVGLGQREERR